MDRKFDVIWIGTGQATMTVVPKLTAAGKTVAVIEGGKFGGTCVNSGCTPTKTLVASAYAIHMARRGADFGFSSNDLKVDFEAVMAPQIANRHATSSRIEMGLSELNGCTVYRGFGKFIDSHNVEVGEHQLTGGTIVLHVGTRPRLPSISGVDSIDWLTNESILDLKELPGHLIIVGGGYIALEFAQIFRRLGSRVSIVIRGARLLSKEDDDIALAIEQFLEDEGIEIIRNAIVQDVTSRDGVTAQLNRNGDPRTLAGTHMLFAIGRIPNSDGLNLGNAGIDVDRNGYIQVNDFAQTNLPHVYALGDVNGRGGYTHTSVNDGEIFWDRYSRQINANPEPPQLDRRIGMRPFVSSMFTDPPLARIGLTEAEARNTNRNVLIATMPMNNIARAREKRETNGLVKILVDRETEQFLGVTVLGTSGDEVIGSFAAFMQTGGSYKLFRRTVFPHPTVSELMPWCLDRLRPLECE